MPDNVSVGQSRQYYVDSNPGSTYTWWIDGVVQAGFTSNEFFHTWDCRRYFFSRGAGTLCVRMSGTGEIRTGICNTGERYTLIIHNAFSPNGDLVNDLWNIGNSDLYPEIEVTHL